MTAAFIASRYDGFITRPHICVYMKWSESLQVYYDYENVLSFDNIRDTSHLIYGGNDKHGNDVGVSVLELSKS